MQYIEMKHISKSVTITSAIYVHNIEFDETVLDMTSNMKSHFQSLLFSTGIWILKMWKEVHEVIEISTFMKKKTKNNKTIKYLVYFSLFSKESFGEFFPLKEANLSLWVFWSLCVLLYFPAVSFQAYEKSLEKQTNK